MVSAIVFLAANYIGEYAIKDIRTIDAIKVTCPAMVFIALSNILKGYFWGTSQVTAPAIIDIFEKALRIVTVAILIFLFKATELKELVMLCYVALALGELQSLLLLYIYYKQSVKKLPVTSERVERRSQLLFNVLIISLPLTLTLIPLPTKADISIVDVCILNSQLISAVTLAIFSLTSSLVNLEYLSNKI